MASLSKYLMYPFSLEARQTARRLARDIHALVELLDEPSNHYVVGAAEERVYEALTRHDVTTTVTGNELDFLVYPTARLIVEAIGHPRLREYQAEAESKAVNRHLNREREDFVTALARTSFDWAVESLGDITKRVRLPLLMRGFELKMRVEHFLEVAPSFHRDEWKLVNRLVDHGWVLVRLSELCRLMSGKFSQLILSSRTVVPALPARLAEAVQRIESELRGKIRTTEPIKITGQVMSAFPPCIAQIYADTTSGKNPSHEARFTLASFLLKIGMSEEEILGVFRPTRDFVASTAEYQVRHIASKAGGEGYTPPGCKKLQSNGFCPVYLGDAWDPLCEYVLHPLAFYQTRAWEVSTGVTDHSWYAKKKRKKQSF